METRKNETTSNDDKILFGIQHIRYCVKSHVVNKELRKITSIDSKAGNVIATNVDKS